MTFIEAIEALKQGKKVSRKAYIDNLWLSKTDRDEEIRISDFLAASFTILDLIADDWYIFEQENRDVCTETVINIDATNNKNSQDCIYLKIHTAIDILAPVIDKFAYKMKNKL